MEKITMERLTTDLVGVIAQINEIVAKKDIVSARTVLSQVAELIANENEVPLDKAVSDGQYDHVLHELLSKINGVIEIVEEKNNDPEIQKLTDELSEIDSLLNGGADKLRETLEKRIAKLDKDIIKYTDRLTALRSAEVKEPLSEEDRKALLKQIREVTKELTQNENGITERRTQIGLLQGELDQEAEKDESVLNPDKRKDLETRLKEAEEELATLNAETVNPNEMSIDEMIAELDRQINALTDKIVKK